MSGLAETTTEQQVRPLRIPFAARMKCSGRDDKHFRFGGWIFSASVSLWLNGIRYGTGRIQTQAAV
jgi:hypothetical protein